MSRYKHRGARVDLSGAPAASARRAQRVSQRVSWNSAIVGVGLALGGLGVYVAVRGSPVAPEVADALPDSSGDVRLSAFQFDDGQARFFRYSSADGRSLRFFVVRSADGIIRAAFDTCDVCSREGKGYRQVRDTMVCNYCGRTVRSVDVNVARGGCNPVPLDRVVHDGQVILTGVALKAGMVHF